MKKQITLVSLTVLSLVAGCDNEPAKDKTKVQANAPVVQTAPPAADAATQTEKWQFSAADSKIEFTGAKITGKHDGLFGDFKGTIDLNRADLTKSQIEVVIQTASLESEPEKLVGHLKSADFFDVEKFPTATFSSTSIVEGGADGATHTVTGNLTLHGEKKSITFPAKIQASADSVSADAEFAINRKDFGIVYPGMPDDLIKDDVLIRLSLKPSRS